MVVLLFGGEKLKTRELVGIKLLTIVNLLKVLVLSVTTILIIVRSKSIGPLLVSF